MLKSEFRSHCYQGNHPNDETSHSTTSLKNAGWKLSTVCIGSGLLIAVVLKGHSFWYTTNSLLTVHTNFLTGLALENEVGAGENITLNRRLTFDAVIKRKIETFKIRSSALSLLICLM
jgi:hypothetical protein